MDIDTAHLSAQNHGADDDLIDYDTDMVDQPEGDWSHVRGSMRPNQDDVSLEDIELDNVSGHSLEVVERTVPDEMDDLDLEVAGPPSDGKDSSIAQIEEDEAQPAQAEDGGDDPSTASQDHHDDYVDLGEDLENQEHSVYNPGDDESAHEIDYDDDDEQDHSQDQVAEGTRGEGDTSHADTEAAAEVSHTQLGVDESETGSPDGNKGETSNAEHSEHDEINWNEFDGHGGRDSSITGDQEDIRETDQPALEDTEEAAASQHVTEIEENDEQAGQGSVEDHEGLDQPNSTQHEDDEAENYGEFAEGDYQDEEEAAGSQAAEAAVSVVGTTSSPDSEFPKITVQYKGDEFPCFSTTSEGFFTDISILDDTMEALLSKFREELVNEIPHEDELVFQVDELGLEFAESSLRDSLSSVTMRQILEIFDLLVKNQDPDNSRALYTYLFTKPSTSRRLEFLIDSATAGKGLDEVIHLFESPMPNSTGLLGTNIPVHDFDEPLDEYESPDNILESHGDGLQRQNEHDGEAEDDAGYSVLDDGYQPSPEVDEDYVDAQVDEGNTVGPSVQEEQAEAGGVSLTEITLPETADEDAPNDSESNPFLTLELDTEPNDEVGLGSDYGDNDSTQNDARDTDGLHAIANTSTTSTLRADDDAASITLDVGDLAEDDATATGATVQGLEDELEEIDWIEDTDADQEVPYTPSGTGKRGRIDDDADAEDEKDVKRRRS